MSVTNIAVFDLELFKGITFEMGFQLEYVDVDGNPTSTYPNLTGKTQALIFNGVFPETVTLIGDDPVNDLGSFATIVDAVTGQFSFKLSADQLHTVSNVDGYWRVEVQDDPQADLVLRGSLRVLPFTPGGSIL